MYQIKIKVGAFWAKRLLLTVSHLFCILDPDPQII